MRVGLHVSHDLHGFGEALAFFVRPVLGGQCFEDVGDGHDARGDRHVPGVNALRVAGPIHLLVVPAGVLRNAVQVARERQRLQHLHRFYHMMIDDQSFFVRERPATGAQIVDLVVGEGGSALAAQGQTEARDSF